MYCTSFCSQAIKLSHLSVLENIQFILQVSRLFLGLGLSDKSADLHLLLNTLAAPALRSSASASWLPICLPKFNPQGFLYCYVSFLDAQENSLSEKDEPADAVDETPIGLAIVTPDRDGFEKIRSLADVSETVSKQVDTWFARLTWF